jgi:hypothetical protein
VTHEELAAIEAAFAAWEMARREQQPQRPACHGWPAMTAEEVHARTLALEGPDAMADWNGLSAIIAWQKGRCAICGSAKFDLVTDHDHATALVRGQLCQRCNNNEARSDEPRYVAYRARPPAAILGVQEVYWSSWDGGYAVPAPVPASPEALGRLQAERDPASRRGGPA